MNKLAWAAAGLIALSAAPALAADLPAKVYTKAPMIAPVYSWAGFYVGGNGGGGWAHDCRTNISTGLGLGCYDPSGAVAGGQIGYRWQMMNNWVFGIEAQGDWADINGSRQNQVVAANRLGTKLDAFGLFTGQVGYAWSNVLWYAKGGAAVVDQRFDFISNATNTVFASTGSDTRWGGTVGTGVEIGFAPNWSVAFEYDHIFLGKRSGPFTVTATGAATADSYTTGGDVDLATVRLNYTFGGPVVAKY
jgi:outer membrane immunogenic protein